MLNRCIGVFSLLLTLSLPVIAQSLQPLEAGGIVTVFKSSASLRNGMFVPVNIAYGTTTIDIEVDDSFQMGHVQLFAVNNIVRVQKLFIGDTWLKVSSVTDISTHWKYTMIVMAGTSNVVYPAGLKVANYGSSGDGFVAQVADQVNSPNIQLGTHASRFSSLSATGTLDVTPRLKMGGLGGSYGLTGNVFGLGVGPFIPATGQKWASMDEVNGVRTGIEASLKTQLGTDGVRLAGTPAFDPGPTIQFFRSDTGAAVSTVQHSIDPSVLSGHTLLIKAEQVSGLSTGIEIQSLAQDAPAEIHLRTNVNNSDRTGLKIDNEGVTVTTTQGVFSPPDLTTVQRDALPFSTKSGIIRNITTGKYQMRTTTGTWVDF